jgi:hypothetical protein
MITSYIPGRLRVRLSAPPENAPENIDVSAWPGVKKLTFNPASGGCLLEYDPDKLSLAAIAETVEAFDPEAAEELRFIDAGGSRYPQAARHPQPGQATKDFISLSLSLITSITTAFWGPKKWHAYSGLFLAGVAAAHAWRYRHRVKPISKWTVEDVLGLPDPRPERVEEEDFDDQSVDAAEAEEAPKASKAEAAPSNSGSNPGFSAASAA